MRWSSEIRQDLFWWFDRKRLELVISLEQVSSQLDLGSELCSGGVCGQHDSAGLPAEFRGGGGHQSCGFWAGRLMIFCAGRSAIPSLFCPSSSWGATPCWQILFSRLNPILGYVWTLKPSVFQQLQRRWPVSPDLFATSLTHRYLPYFSPFHNSNALGTGSSQTMGWVAGVCSSSLCAYSCDSVNSSAHPLGSC